MSQLVIEAKANVSLERTREGVKRFSILGEQSLSLRNCEKAEFHRIQIRTNVKTWSKSAEKGGQVAVMVVSTHDLLRWERFGR